MLTHTTGKEVSIMTSGNFKSKRTEKDSESDNCRLRMSYLCAVLSSKCQRVNMLNTMNYVTKHDKNFSKEIHGGIVKHIARRTHLESLQCSIAMQFINSTTHTTNGCNYITATKYIFVIYSFVCIRLQDFFFCIILQWNDETLPDFSNS